MPDETKSPTPPPSGEPKAPAGAPNPPSVEPVPAQKPGDPAAKPSPAGSAAPRSEAAPPKPAASAAVAWNSPLITTLQQRYGTGIREASTYLGQNYMVVERSMIPEVLQVLRDQHQFDYCVDITAVHYPQREKQFDLVWILYSFGGNERIRVKTMIGDGEIVPSSVSIWPTANWLEREVYDMFGIRFDGHVVLRHGFGTPKTVLILSPNA